MITVYVLWLFVAHTGAVKIETYATAAYCNQTGRAVKAALDGSNLGLSVAYVCVSQDKAK